MKISRVFGVVVVSVGSVALAVSSGCASQAGPNSLVIDAGQYDEAFDAAIEATRQAGMPAVFMDRRAGIIETEPRIAGSLLEPWRQDNASFNQALENTVSLQRRRVRYEFRPTDQAPITFDVASGDQPRAGEEAESTEGAPGDIVADKRVPPLDIDDAPLDLTEYTGPIEVFAVVSLERASTPEVQRSTWTRRHRARVHRDLREYSGTRWRTIARDVAFERRLLADVEQMIGE